MVQSFGDSYSRWSDSHPFIHPFQFQPFTRPPHTPTTIPYSAIEGQGPAAGGGPKRRPQGLTSNYHRSKARPSSSHGGAKDGAAAMGSPTVASSSLSSASSPSGGITSPTRSSPNSGVGSPVTLYNFPQLSEREREHWKVPWRLYCLVVLPLRCMVLGKTRGYYGSYNLIPTRRPI